MTQRRTREQVRGGFTIVLDKDKGVAAPAAASWFDRLTMRAYK
jgi:hypothetical protein